MRVWPLSAQRQMSKSEKWKGRWDIESPTKSCMHLVNTNIAGFHEENTE